MCIYKEQRRSSLLILLLLDQLYESAVQFKFYDDFQCKSLTYKMKTMSLSTFIRRHCKLFKIFLTDYCNEYQ